MNKTFGGILLVAGCSLGAGMLAIPVVTGMSGFLPSLTMLFAVWLFMAYTGLLLLEVNLWYGKNISIITMAEKTLGTIGKTVTWLIYLFLFYSLMNAYISGSGALFVDFFKYFLHIEIPEWLGSLFFSSFFGVLIFLGTKYVDHFNRYLMLGLLIAYVLLLVSGFGHIRPNLLSYQRWSLSPWITPVLITSFGYHNMIPSLNDYLDGNTKRLRTVIIIGSLVPLIVYILWCTLILGIIPIESLSGSLQNQALATQALKNVVGNPIVLVFADCFAFFAVITSLMGVALSFVDFWADGLKIKKTVPGKILLCCLVIIPSLVISITYPKIFLTAINYAGGFGAVTLFGILPALMVWSGRYKKKMSLEKPLPGGKFALILVIFCAVMVFTIEGLQEFGLSPMSSEIETTITVEDNSIK